MARTVGPEANVISMTRRLEGLEHKRYTRLWKARADSDPQWAADQIDGLLARALHAESKLEGLRAAAAVVIDHATPEAHAGLRKAYDAT